MDIDGILQLLGEEQQGQKDEKNDTEPLHHMSLLLDSKILIFTIQYISKKCAIVRLFYKNCMNIPEETVRIHIDVLLIQYHKQGRDYNVTKNFKCACCPADRVSVSGYNFAVPVSS